MDAFALDQLLAAAVFMGARVSGLMVFCPFLGSNAIPMPVKARSRCWYRPVVPLHGPMRADWGLGNGSAWR